MKPDIFSFSKYLLIDAHPDDEVHCAVLLHRLIKQGLHVKAIVLTNGDAGQNPGGRVSEMVASARHIGLTKDNLVFLGIPEKELLGNMAVSYEKTLEIAAEYKPDCILSLDFDGGHEGHDTASFISHLIAQKVGATHIVFPDYFFKDMRRHGLEFMPDREADYTVALSDKEKDLKIKVLEAHSGQLGFYLRMQKYQDNYFSLLFARELYRVFPDSYDYLSRPDYQIGYEHHRNGFKFTDFVNAAGPVLDQA